MKVSVSAQRKTLLDSGLWENSYVEYFYVIFNYGRNFYKQNYFHWWQKTISLIALQIIFLYRIKTESYVIVGKFMVILKQLLWTSFLLGTLVRITSNSECIYLPTFQLQPAVNVSAFQLFPKTTPSIDCIIGLEQWRSL